jgi:hypothetical protein
MIPYRVSFNSAAEGSSEIFEKIIDFFFIADIRNDLIKVKLYIVLSFNSGYYEQGNLLLNRKKIIFHYVKTWFFIDMVSSFPYSLVLTYATNQEEQ